MCIVFDLTDSKITLQSLMKRTGMTAEDVWEILKALKIATRDDNSKLFFNRSQVVYVMSQEVRLSSIYHCRNRSSVMSFRLSLLSLLLYHSCVYVLVVHRTKTVSWYRLNCMM